MKRIPLLIVIALSTLLLAASVYAQTRSLDANSASLSLVETIPVTANVEVNLNGQIYKLAIPVTSD